MRQLTTIFLIIISSALFAGHTPDSTAVAKLYSTSWSLLVKYKVGGIFHRLHKVPASENQQHITIYKDEIHISVNNGPYQICASRHRNQNEFWLDCKEADQLIYRVMRIDAEELVIDILTKLKGETQYKRTGRNFYRRSRN